MNTLASLREAAAEWVVQLDAAAPGASGESVRAACAAWRAQSPAHDAVFRQCQRLWQAVEQKPRARAGRRAVAIVGPLLLLAVLWQLPWQIWTADVRAPAGDLRKVTLEDGSRLTLNRGSAVDLAFDARQRTVHLIAGEVLAEVAHDAAGRPFRVTSRDGVAQARGTRYLVRQDETGTTLTVLESIVAAIPALRSDLHSDVHAGQQLRFDAQQVYEISAAPVAAAAWVQQRLVFEDAPLSEVLAALNQGHAGWLRLSGDRAAQMRFTGVLPADDTDAALAQLQRALPLRSRQFTPYLQWVEARSE